MRSWKFQSSSSPKIYTTQIGDNGLLSCDCPGWTVKKLGKVRECKHTKKVASDEHLSLSERDGQLFVVGSTTTTRPPPAPSSPFPTKIATSTEAMRELLTEHQAGFVSPMLASAMPEDKTADDFRDSGWIMEEKFDGHRLIVRVVNYPIAGKNIAKGVMAWSRLGNVRTLPRHIEAPLSDLPVGVYDGELLVPGAKSYGVMAGQNSGKEIFVLFDMLESSGKSIMKTEQHVRRAFLEIAYDVFYDHIEFPVRLAEQHKPSMEFVKAVWARGGEGAIIKKLSGRYTPGWRSPDWIKVKAIGSATLTIVGFKEGKNGPYSIVKLRDSAGMETTAKTLDNNMMRQFAKDPNSFIGKRMVVSYHEKTPSGKLRHIMVDHLAGVGE